MAGGKYSSLEENGSLICVTVGLPENAGTGNFGVIRVQEGGRIDVLKTTLENGAISFETTPQAAALVLLC